MALAATRGGHGAPPDPEGGGSDAIIGANQACAATIFVLWRCPACHLRVPGSFCSFVACLFHLVSGCLVLLLLLFFLKHHQPHVDL